eukprot:scaffold70_cov242-Pinguiococcus_pyrenoidosus.AAC.9
MPGGFLRRLLRPSRPPLRLRSPRERHSRQPVVLLLEQERVAQGLVRQDAQIRIDLQTSLYKIRQVVAGVLEAVPPQVLGAREAPLAPALADEGAGRRALVVEEAALLGTLQRQVLGNRAEHLLDAQHQVDLIRAREDRPSGEQLGHDAPERPHVDRVGVGQAQHDLRRPVESRLNVRVCRVALLAGRAEVDHSHASGTPAPDGFGSRSCPAGAPLPRRVRCWTAGAGAPAAPTPCLSPSPARPPLAPPSPTVLVVRSRSVPLEALQPSGRTLQGSESGKPPTSYLVVAADAPQESDLLQALDAQPALVADDLQRHVAARAVVFTPDDRAEAAAAQHARDLVAIGDVVAQREVVRASLVIEAAVGRQRVHLLLSLGRQRARRPDAPVVVQDLRLLEVGQALREHSQTLRHRHPFSRRRWRLRHRLRTPQLRAHRERGHQGRDFALARARGAALLRSHGRFWR